MTAISTDRDLDTSAFMHVTHGDTAADHCRVGHTGAVALAGGGVAPPASRSSTRALGSSVSRLAITDPAVPTPTKNRLVKGEVQMPASGPTLRASFGDPPAEMGHRHLRLGSPLIAEAFDLTGRVSDDAPARQTCGISRSADTMSAAIGSPTWIVAASQCAKTSKSRIARLSRTSEPPALPIRNF